MRNPFFTMADLLIFYMEVLSDNKTYKETGDALLHAIGNSFSA